MWLGLLYGTSIKVDFHQLNLPDWVLSSLLSTVHSPETPNGDLWNGSFPRVEHYEIDCLHAQSYCRITNATQECTTRHLKEKVTWSLRLLLTWNIKIGTNTHYYLRNRNVEQSSDGVLGCDEKSHQSWLKHDNVHSDKYFSIASTISCDDVTLPKMPFCAVIISNATVWNLSLYDADASETTIQ